MKNILFFFSILTVFMHPVAADDSLTHSQKPTDINPHKTVLNFTLPPFKTAKNSANDADCHSISVQGWTTVSESGVPQLRVTVPNPDTEFICLSSKPVSNLRLLGPKSIFGTPGYSPESRH